MALDFHVPYASPFTSICRALFFSETDVETPASASHMPHTTTSEVAEQCMFQSNRTEKRKMIHLPRGIRRVSASWCLAARWGRSYGLHTPAFSSVWPHVMGPTHVLISSDPQPPPSFLPPHICGCGCWRGLAGEDPLLLLRCLDAGSSAALTLGAARPPRRRELGRCQHPDF
jgi:hypothetical protein